MSTLLVSGPDTATLTLVLAHGAGAPMDSPFMNQMAELLADRAVRVARFEFPYMVSRRETGKRKPAPKAELLQDAFRAAVAGAREQFSGVIAAGGKSMGGRVGSLVADQLFASGIAQGLVCLGYPFHPPGIPEQLRTAHLEKMQCPAMVVQGERDPFGCKAEVEAFKLSSAIRICWIGDGDHDFGARGSSGFTRKGNLTVAADAVAEFMSGLM